MTDLVETWGDPNLEQVPVLARVYDEDFEDLTSARLDLPFTKSRGTIMSRLYERLTKRSRRRVEGRHHSGMAQSQEEYYREGVYDAYQALQDEMA